MFFDHSLAQTLLRHFLKSQRAMQLALCRLRTFKLSSTRDVSCLKRPIVDWMPPV